jgi:cell division protein FtsI (penicillin-binding protein 3)
MSVTAPRARVVRRTAVVGYTLAALLLVGLAYAGLLQVGYGRDCARVAQNQQKDSIVLLASRGRILDAQGRALALNHSSFQVSIYPTLLKVEPKCTTRLIAAHKLAAICDLDYGAVLRKLETMPGWFVFAPSLDFDRGVKLKAAMRKAQMDNMVSVQPLSTRVYPFGDTLGSIVGFSQDNLGKAGFEQVLNPVLTGVPGKIVVQKDALGNQWRYPDYPEVEPIPGSDVYLTVDVDVQRIAYEELRMCVDSFHADQGSVIIMDARTGEVKAMCDYPYRDPRRQWPRGVAPTFTSPSAEASFEPGSAFKPIIGLAALESPNADRLRRTIFDVSAGKIEIDGKVIHDVHSCGVQDFPGIFIKSSNVGLSMLSMMVNRATIYETMRRLGFGRPVGIELPQESPGHLDAEYRTAPDKLSKLRVANNAFGQGLQTSLVQLAACYGAIANDGLLKRPYLVDRVVLNDSITYHNEALTVRRAVSKSAAREMRDILGRVVSEGTGIAAKSPFFEVCGKTGTAEKALPGRGYSDGQYIATFVGFFPREQPLYVVALSVDNPRLGRFAGTIVCPTYRRIAERCFWFAQARDIARGQPPVARRACAGLSDDRSASGSPLLVEE